MIMYFICRLQLYCLWRMDWLYLQCYIHLEIFWLWQGKILKPCSLVYLTSKPIPNVKCRNINGISKERENWKTQANSGEQQGEKKNNTDTTFKNKNKWTTWMPPKKWRLTQVFWKSKQSLLHAGHLSCQNIILNSICSKS